jgi:hypothetical protein
VFAYHPSNGGSSTVSCTQHCSTSITTTAFVYAALFLFPAIFITLPKPSPHELGTGLLVGFTTIANTWAGFVFVLLQFIPQYLEMRRVSAIPGSLSPLSLALQAVIILAIAIRWLLRLGPKTWGNQAALLWYWYQWGVLPSTYIIHAVGCAIWLALYSVTGRAREECGDFLTSKGRSLLA